MIDTRECTGMIKSGGREFLPGPVETSLKGFTRPMKEMDMVRCIGRMEVIIKGIGLMVFSMVRVRSEVI